MSRDGKKNAGYRRHLIWAQCGNCHTWNKFMVSVKGTEYVHQKCNGDNCDCNIIVSLPGNRLPTLEQESKLTIVTELAGSVGDIT